MLEEVFRNSYLAGEFKTDGAREFARACLESRFGSLSPDTLAALAHSDWAPLL